jgi:hypothetical protein
MRPNEIELLPLLSVNDRPHGADVMIKSVKHRALRHPSLSAAAILMRTSYDSPIDATAMELQDLEDSHNLITYSSSAQKFKINLLSSSCKELVP